MDVVNADFVATPWMEDDCKDAGGRVTQGAVTDDCKDAGGRVTQGAVTEVE